MKHATVLFLIMIGAAISSLAQTSIPLDEQLNQLRERAKAPIEDDGEPKIQDVARARPTPVVRAAATPSPTPQAVAVAPAQNPPMMVQPISGSGSAEALPAHGASEIHESDKSESERVWVLDPRKSLREEVSSSGYEPTSLYVQRVLYIAGYKPGSSMSDDSPDWVSKIPLNIPVMHRTRYIRLDEQGQVKIKDVLKRLIAVTAKAKEIRAEVESILKEYNGIIDAGTPKDVLTPDSPSLTTNQGGEINEGKPEKGFEAGKEINFSIN
jgi:hypothetical protein